MPLAIQLPPRADQTAFNLRRWEEILADPELARLEQRIETDRHGHIIMTPPPGPPHGTRQFDEGEIWLCDEEGAMNFFTPEGGGTPGPSRHCPGFPLTIPL